MMATVMGFAQTGSYPIDVVTASLDTDPAQAQPASAIRHDPVYMMGRSKRETHRLTVQAQVYEPATRRILEQAGIRPGMHILDIGSGAGDVAMLAARLTGPAGAVVGVDANAEILETAKARADASGFRNVRFIAADMRDLPPLPPFDAIIGRLVLMYVADPVAALSSLLPRLKPGGIVAFAEFNLVGESVGFWPSLPLWRQCIRWIQAVPAGTGLEFAMGWKLHRTFAAAGLPDPGMSLESPLGNAADGAASFILAGVMQSMLPLFTRLGIASETDIEIGTLHSRLQAEAIAAGAIIKLPELVGAWTRKELGAHRATAA